MSNNRQLHRFYGLFPTLVLDHETEEMMHDEGLLARFWGAWFDSCMTCWGAIVWDAAHGNPLIELMDNISRTMAMSVLRPMVRREAKHG